MERQHSETFGFDAPDEAGPEAPIGFDAPDKAGPEAPSTSNRRQGSASANARGFTSDPDANPLTKHRGKSSNDGLAGNLTKHGIQFAVECKTATSKDTARKARSSRAMAMPASESSSLKSSGFRVTVRGTRSTDCRRPGPSSIHVAWKPSAEATAMHTCNQLLRRDALGPLPAAAAVLSYDCCTSWQLAWALTVAYTSRSSGWVVALPTCPHSDALTNGHIVEVRIETQHESSVEDTLGGCCKPASSSKQLKGAVGSDGYTTFVFCTRDINYIDLKETSRIEVFEDLEKLNCCCACGGAGGRNDTAGAETKTHKYLKIHLKFNTHIYVTWNDTAKARPSDRELCCAPTTGRSSTSNSRYEGDGTRVTTITYEENEQPPTCALVQGCYPTAFNNKFTTEHKYVLHPKYRERCEVESEDLNTLANVLGHLMTEDRVDEIHTRARGAAEIAGWSSSHLNAGLDDGASLAVLCGGGGSTAQKSKPKFMIIMAVLFLTALIFTIVGTAGTSMIVHDGDDSSSSSSSGNGGYSSYDREYYGTPRDTRAHASSSTTEAGIGVYTWSYKESSSSSKSCPRSSGCDSCEFGIFFEDNNWKVPSDILNTDCFAGLQSRCKAGKAFAIFAIFGGFACLVLAIQPKSTRLVVFAGITAFSQMIVFSVWSSMFNNEFDLASSECGTDGTLLPGKEASQGSVLLFCQGYYMPMDPFFARTLPWGSAMAVLGSCSLM